MAYVHSLDIVHSDIKPENMYWTDENKVVLGDLGGAKKLQVGWSDALAGETNYYGAPVSSGYINTKDDVALREAFQKRDFDRWSLLKKKADVFALGLSFAEIFLGQDALRKLLNDTTMRANVTPPEKFQQQLCEALSKVGASNEARGAILSMLNVDPDQRVTMQEALKLWKK
jgi:serine/threonine protein kinase